MDKERNYKQNTPERSYHVRMASLSDLDAIAGIEQTCSSMPWHTDSLRYDLSDHNNAFYWVAELENTSKIVAYSACRHMVDDAEIMNIAVLPEWRRIGIARQLLLIMESHARQSGLEAMYLEVRESNSPARRLYRESGYTEITFRYQYYANNRENAIIMSKNIS